MELLLPCLRDDAQANPEYRKMSFHDASSQTERPEDLDEATKTDILESFAMELFLTSVLPRIEAVLVQNHSFNVWHDDLGSLAEEDVLAASDISATLSELQSFTDMSYSQGRCVAALQWVPARKGAIAMTCTLPPREAQEHFGILVWTFAVLMHPEFILESPIEVTCFEFNPGQPNVVVGGCCNGQIIMWDYGREVEADGRKGASATGGQPRMHPPICMSSIDHSHVGTATDVQWLSSVAFSKEGATAQQGGTDDKLQTSYIASTALDGKVLFWDCTYALSYEGEGDIESPWKPVCIIALRALEVETLGLACTRISFANPASSLKLLASSLLGDIISCSYSAAETEDGKKPGQSRPQTGSNCHFGCILTLQRSPFLPHIVLSAGGYDWALYQDHFLEAPLMRSPYAPVQCTCAAWSPTRPGCLASGREDGIVEVWDLLDRWNEPVISCTVSMAMVTSLCFSPPEEQPDSSAKYASHKQYLAVGSSVGLLHLMEVPRYLRKRAHNELRAMEELMQQHVQVAEYMAKSMARSPEEMLNKAKEPSPYDVPKFTLPPLTEEEQRIDELEYMKLEAFYRAEWGLKPGGTL